MKIKILNFKLLFIVLVVCAYITNGVVITLYSVSMADRSSTLQDKISILKEENIEYSSQLFSKTSINKIYELTSGLGYNTSDDLIYLSGEKPVAELR